MKACPVCLLNFHPKNPKKKYCSKICKNRADYIRQLKIIIELKCFVCNKTFSVHPPHKNQKYCSIGCWRTLPPSKETKEKLRTTTLKNGNIPPHAAGKNHYRWIEDRTKLKDDHRDRGGQLSRDWARNVKVRDLHKCKLSNKDCCGKIEAHHILGWSTFPELRYDINNGITLCKYHHPRKRVDEIRLSPYFQEIIRKLNY